MKIVAGCRTFNEERHVRKFCEAYQDIADLIIIADGGSTDNTVKIAKKMPKTLVIDYDVKVECQNGIWRNPDGPHIQFLIDRAVLEGADWIIFQDCDMRPNKYLKEGARDLFKMMDSVQKDFLMLTQIFVWQKDKYFKDLSYQGGRWMQGLWAWRANLNLQIINKMPHFEFSYDGKTSILFDKTGKDLAVQPPMCYLHYGWEDFDKTTEHVEYYRNSGLISNMLFPTQFGGTPVPLENWMIE